MSMDAFELESVLSRLHELADRVALSSVSGSLSSSEMEEIAGELRERVDALASAAGVRLEALAMPSWVVYDPYTSGSKAYLELFADQQDAQAWLQEQQANDDDGYCGCEVYSWAEALDASGSPPEFYLLSRWRTRTRAAKAENAIMGAFK